MISRHIPLLLALWLVSAAAGRPAGKNAGSRLLIASDVHFNPMADPALVAGLAAAEPSQWEAVFQRSKDTAFSSYGQDPNWWLLRSGLDAMVRTEPHPALVMFTGDLLAHNFHQIYSGMTHDNDPEHYRAFALKTVDFIALEFRKRFAAAKILVTPGNNDQYCRITGLNRMEHSSTTPPKRLAILRKKESNSAPTGKRWEATA